MTVVSLDVCDHLSAADTANSAPRVGPRILAGRVAVDCETKLARRRDQFLSLALVPVVPLEPRLYLLASMQIVSFHDLYSSANAEEHRVSAANANDCDWSSFYIELHRWPLTIYREPMLIAQKPRDNRAHRERCGNDVAQSMLSPKLDHSRRIS